MEESKPRGPIEIAYQTFDRDDRIVWKRKTFFGADPERDLQKWAARNADKIWEVRFGR